jgi:hypothetical protein
MDLTAVCGDIVAVLLPEVQHTEEVASGDDQRAMIITGQTGVAFLSPTLAGNLQVAGGSALVMYPPDQ